MSALEQTPLSNSDRRGAARIRVTDELPVFIGRGDGTLVDLSERGAKIRHRTMIRRGTTVRISTGWNGARFSVTAEVLASRVVTLGDGERGGTTYETRLRFVSLDDHSAEILSRMLDELSGRETRRWVANLRGWGDEPAVKPGPSTTGSFFRCRWIGFRWDVKCTHDASQPADGFTVPANITNDEIVTLCADYLRAGVDEREMIRAMATSAVEHSGVPALRQVAS